MLKLRELTASPIHSYFLRTSASQEADIWELGRHNRDHLLLRPTRVTTRVNLEEFRVLARKTGQNQFTKATEWPNIPETSTASHPSSSESTTKKPTRLASGMFTHWPARSVHSTSICHALLPFAFFSASHFLLVLLPPLTTLIHLSQSRPAIFFFQFFPFAVSASSSTR